MVQVGLETNLTDKILKHLKNHGHKAIKLHVDQYQEAGTPDIFACVNGFLLVIEVKRPGEEPTRIQRIRLMQWRKAGAFILVADNMDTLQLKLDEIYRISEGIRR